MTVNAPGSINAPSIAPRYPANSAMWLPRRVKVPTGFGWTPAWSVYETAPGVFAPSLQPSSLKITGTAVTRYCNIARPDNTGDGLSPATADKSIWAALNSVSDSTTLYILGSANPNTPTMYDYDNAWRSAWFHDGNVIVVSDFTTLAPGYAISSTYMAPGGADLGTWALGPTEANVYEATLAAAPNTVIDATVTNAATGAATRLTLQVSAAAVQANPGSYYHAGGILYVRTADSRAPDASLRALKASVVNGHVNTSTVDCYIEGMTFEGGNARCLFIQAATTVSLVNVHATHGQSEGLSLTSSTASGSYTIHMINCSARDCDADGLQYTTSGAGAVCRALEWCCTSKGNNGAGTDQGSSAHFTAGNTSVSVVRIGCTFASNKSDGVADVGGTTTWALGCRMSSEVDGVQIGDTGTAWLHGCTLTGNTTDLVTDNAGGTINTARTHYTTTSGAGTVQKYQP